MAYTGDLKSPAARLVGSSPTLGTKQMPAAGGHLLAVRWAGEPTGSYVSSSTRQGGNTELVAFPDSLRAEGSASKRDTNATLGTHQQPVQGVLLLL